jgi:hypothetical protein
MSAIGKISHCFFGGSIQSVLSLQKKIVFYFHSDFIAVIHNQRTQDIGKKNFRINMHKIGRERPSIEKSLNLLNRTLTL